MSQEHPFAAYVRILGKGKAGTRSLTLDEARDAFAMILANEVEPIQLGAFLMLLRVKEESAEELAGFVSACRGRYQDQVPDLPAPRLDWSSYAGKKAQQPWYLLSALLLAENGITVLMHGADGHTPGRLYSEETLKVLGIDAADNPRQAAEQIQNSNFSYLPLRNFLPPLHDLMQLRPLLGLRSPVNTLARMLNPLSAPYSIQSVFHPAYMDLHRGTDRLLGQHHSLVFKGDGGEVEIKPQAQTRLSLLRQGIDSEQAWPRSLQGKVAPIETLSPQSLVSLWRGDADDRYGALATCHTAAAALLLLEEEDSPQAAIDRAQHWWQTRNRERF
jgi:anthranilate phosphoribosyltransferase